MSKAIATLFVLALAGAAITNTAAPAVAHAQLDPRTAQAMALCNSPAGKLLTECQQLKAITALGGVPGVQGVAGIAAGNPMAAQAAQQVYAVCVRQAGVNQAAIAQCNANLQRAMGMSPAPATGPFNAYDRNTNTAMNIASGGAGYQQCISAMMAQGGQPGGINPCTPLLSGQPAGPGAPAGFGGGPPAATSGQNAALAAYQACNAQLSLQMRGHECVGLMSGGPPPAGFNMPGSAPIPAPAQGQAYNPPAPGYPGAPPPTPFNDPLSPPANKPFDPLGL